MKKRHLIRFLAIVILIFTLQLSPLNIKAADHYDAVYFGSYGCLVCQSLEDTGVLDQLVEEGYQLKKYMSEDDYTVFESMFSRYARTYEVPRNMNLIPILYVGDTFFIGASTIEEAIVSGLVYDIMDSKALIPPVELIYGDVTFKDLVALIGSTIVLGFLDAFNPCALAMLLMFLSFLTDKKRVRTIIGICLSYIAAIFITYFILGTMLSKALSLLLPYMNIFYFVMITLALFIALLNFSDYFAAKKKNYAEIKNQLPKRFFVVTRKLMENFSNKIESGHQMVYLTAFLIGIFVAIIEFPCSGQAFVAWTAIVVDRTANQMLFFILLFFYVLLFVLPLIVISLVVVKSQNIVGVSNFIRHRLDIIKLINALVFLGIAIYYITIVFF